MPESVPCNLCGSVESVPRLREMRFLGLPDGLRIVECARCGLLFMSPRPTQQEYNLYYNTAEIYSLDSYSTRAEARADFYRRRLQRVESEVGGKGRLLEIGCGAGQFLRMARDAGWKVCGTEASSSFQQHAVNRYDLDVRCATSLTACRFPAENFDAVYSAHVFEHLLDPLTTLLEVRRILRRDGVMLIEVPYQFRSLRDLLRSLLMEVTGPAGRGRVYSPLISAIHHVYFFSPRTLRAMLGKAGFAVHRLHTYEKHHAQVIGDRPLGGYWLTEIMHRAGAALGRGPIVFAIATAP